jgi:hypothetical protein
MKAKKDRYAELEQMSKDQLIGIIWLLEQTLVKMARVAGS